MLVERVSGSHPLLAPQIDGLRVVDTCGCGCPTIHFALRDEDDGIEVVASLGVRDTFDSVLLFVSNTGCLSSMEYACIDEVLTEFPAPIYSPNSGEVADQHNQSDQLPIRPHYWARLRATDDLLRARLGAIPVTCVTNSRPTHINNLVPVCGASARREGRGLRRARGWWSVGDSRCRRARRCRGSGDRNRRDRRRG